MTIKMFIVVFKEFRANSKRKRKFKRMAVDESPENRKPRVTQTPGSKKKKVRSRYYITVLRMI